MSDDNKTPEEEITTPNNEENKIPKIVLTDEPVKEWEDPEPLKDEELITEVLSVIDTNESHFTATVNTFTSKVKQETGTGADNIWLESAYMADSVKLNGDVYMDALDRDNAQWRQKVDCDGEMVSAGRPRFGKSSSSVVSGEKAILKVAGALGLGSLVQIPLWHTGIWVTLKTPSESALLELEKRLAAEKSSLGRYTNGMIFSNSSIYLVSHVVNFILNHVYDASLKNYTQEKLKKIIKVSDIPSLVWGISCAIYPKGYKYARPCTTNPDECQHVVRGEINIPKLFWVDNSSLSDWQRRHMVKRNEKFNDEDLSRYEKEHVRGGDRTVEIKGEEEEVRLTLKLKVPTIHEYELSGFRWIDEITNMVEKLATGIPRAERDTYIQQQGKLTALRKYGHWISSISVEEDTINDQETILGILNFISSEEECVNGIFEAIGKYIEDTVIALIAIPRYKCPSCGGEQKADHQHKRHPHLLPLDAIGIFFTLLLQRTGKSLRSKIEAL